MTLELFARGAISGLSPQTLGHLLDRRPLDDPGLAATVSKTLADVRARGDLALRELAARFDGAELDALEIPEERWSVALAELDPDVRSALERAAANVGRFHRALIPKNLTVETEPGVRVTRVWAPLDRVGVYAPGGTAAYPSSVLMGVVPARAAGVGEVVLCSPPGRDGLPPATVLAAAAIAGADRLFALGGAGAIAALAYGTDSVPPVDAIVGPGNRWVTEAKRQVAGHVGIDSPAGPSEVLVLADNAADPLLVALELAAQAEHDPDAACVAVTRSKEHATRIEAALATAVADTPREDIVRRALRGGGAILWSDSHDEAVAFADRYAPEHLSIMTEDSESAALRIRNAGTTFVGAAASVAFGDYLSGGNHVLPTSGRARSFSGLSTHHFMRSYTVQQIDASGAASMADDVATLARAEGLPAHAAAAAARRPA